MAHVRNILKQSFLETYPNEKVPEEIDEFADDRKCYFVPFDNDDEDFINTPKGTQVVVIETFANHQTWKGLTYLKDSPAAETLEMLYLGHDGIINGTKKDIMETIKSLKNLKEIHVCNYYNRCDDALYDEVEKPENAHLKIVEIC